MDGINSTDLKYSTYRDALVRKVAMEIGAVDSEWKSSTELESEIRTSEHDVGQALDAVLRSYLEWYAVVVAPIADPDSAGGGNPSEAMKRIQELEERRSDLRKRISEHNGGGPSD